MKSLLTQLYVSSIHSPTEGLHHGTDRAGIETVEREAGIESRGISTIAQGIV